MPLRSQIGIAYHVHELDVLPYEGLPLDEAFDVRIESSDGKLATAEKMHRRLLEAHFGFHACKVVRNRHAAILRRLPDWPPLAPSRAATSFEVKPGRVTATGAPLDMLLSFLRRVAALPVVDETGLLARYDFVLEWDTSSEPYALVQAFGDLGLELIFERRDVELLLVEPVQ
jgi:uncharacterized protein (TIGR03435 family)